MLLHIVHPDKHVISEYTFTHLFILNECQSCTSLILCCNNSYFPYTQRVCIAGVGHYAIAGFSGAESY